MSISDSSGIGRVRAYKSINGFWQQIGGVDYSLVGDGNQDYFGTSIDLNYDGTRIVIGAPGHDAQITGLDGGTSETFNGGQVKVFELSNNSADINNWQWVQLGSDILNIEGNAGMGASVTINSAGNFVGIAFPGGSAFGGATGHVKVFKYSPGVQNLNGGNAGSFITSTGWSEHGFRINGVKAGDTISYYSNWIDIDGTGTRIVVGGQGNDTNGDMSGHARVFDFDSSVSNDYGGVWTIVGDEIQGESAKDRMGSAAISSDGKTVILGAQWNDGTTGSNIDIRGHARIFETNE